MWFPLSIVSSPQQVEMNFFSIWLWNMSLRLCTGCWGITAVWTRGCPSSMWNFIHIKYGLFSSVIGFEFPFLFFPNSDNCNRKMSQIFRGLAYIHTVPGVCHRDVKPQNLLVCYSLYLNVPWLCCFSIPNLGIHVL